MRLNSPLSVKLSARRVDAHTCNNMYKQLSALVASVHQNSGDHPLDRYIQLWQKNPQILHVLVQTDRARNERVLGYSICAPMAPLFLDEILRARRTPIKRLLTTQLLLAPEEAHACVPTTGNILFLALSCWLDGVPNFQVALPLFYALQTLFYQLRARVILCETRARDARTVILGSGCELLRRSEGGHISYYFDAGMLQVPNKITSGLGTVMARNWGLPGGSLLSLSPRERIAARALVDAVRIKQLASYFRENGAPRIGQATARHHYRGVLRKAREKIQIDSRSLLIQYLTHHPFELFAPLGEASAPLLSNRI